jgi:hypothetical protein
MTINLLELAKQVQETYTEVECSFGLTKVYHVPHQLVWTYKLDRPEPVMPMVSMELVTGGLQERPIKQGDEGYEEWLLASQSYNKELAELQSAGRFVEALREAEYPADLSTPPPIAEHRYNGHWPQNETLQKKLWLDYTILAVLSDLNIIVDAMGEMSSRSVVTSDDVENVKKNSASISKGQPKRKPK